MDVFVARSGGLAGIRLTWHVRVDDQPDADDWFVLIEEIPWDDVPPAPAEPDRFTWDIRCEPADEQPPAASTTTQKAAEVTLAERQLTGPWRQLVDRVRETTEPKREAPRAPRSR
ncbi:protealysin inhibitor emfourin [Agromyces sp. Leaf222]|uniref:protealysin inhibitor emfourin n=1 Tax=Agromyces sp. Leaf222 TaxID=1735688 RepID=UPI0009EBBE9E|nr:protealysin inhibitor emfourin [Agromyces sp. Leaf222]